METHRLRCAESLRRTLTRILRDEGTLLRVTEVRLSRDRGVADVWVTALDATDRDDFVSGLQKKEGPYRHALGAFLKMRSIPKLRFHWDTLEERAAAVEERIRTWTPKNLDTKAS